MLYLFLGLVSVCIGSFLNVVIYRLPKMIEYETLCHCALALNQPEPPKQQLNLCLPRSFCPNCNKQISAISNIPIVSFILQRGKCKNCNEPISKQYILVEILTLTLSLFAAWHFGWTMQLLFALGFIYILIPLTVIDLHHYLLPDSLTLSLLWLGLLANTKNLFSTLPEAVIGAVVAYICLWLVMHIYFHFTKKVGMGHGDFKLFAALAAWFGYLHIPFILLFSSIIGVIVGLVYLKITKQSRQTPIPFGPFLALSGLGTLFYGEAFLNWYLSY